MALTEVMKREYKPRSGISVGGIGTGGIELHKDGVFRNWRIFNNSPFGSGPELDWRDNSMLFFVVRYQEQGKNPRMKLLQIDEGSEVAGIPNHIYTVPWITGVDRIDSEKSYPFTRLRFSDADMPFVVEMEAFTPFVPHDVKNSSLPATIFNFTVMSKTKRPVDIMLMATLRNAIGYDVDHKRFATKLKSGRDYRLFESTAELVDPAHPSYGTQAMASLASDSTYYLGWEHRHPYYEIVIRNPKLPNINDTDGRNHRKDEKTGRMLARGRANSTIAVSRSLSSRGVFEHAFVMSWCCPNLYSDATAKEKARKKRKPRRFEGHYYSNFFSSAAEVAAYVIRNLQQLDTRTRAFHADFFNSSAPRGVLDQVNSQLNTFVTSSWLTKSMDFGIQEGMVPERNYGPLATIDVAMYGSLTTAALFPELDKAMMRAHKRLQQPSGEVCHGIGRNFATHDIQEGVHGRLDLPSQYVILALRGYFWTGDKAYLREMWPSVKKALEYVLRERDPNGDLLPDMAGAMCTYDNFPMYGAASYVASLWLAALAYAARAGEAAGDKAAAQRYRDILDQGRPVFEQKLWNGSYYRLYNDAGGERGDSDEGCLTDQIIGQWATHFVGDESLLKSARVRKALRSILKQAYQPAYGLLNCRWPGDEFLHDVDPNCWSDQANTCWTGVELAFASFLIYEGFVKQGLELINNVDKRYRKAGMYWSHQEFGGHYYRPMSAWGIVNALLGLSIDKDDYTFAPRIDQKDLKLFFSFGRGTAHYRRTSNKTVDTITVAVDTGKFTCRRLTLGLKNAKRQAVAVTVDGRKVPAGEVETDFDKETVHVRFAKALKVEAGEKMVVKVG